MSKDEKIIFGIRPVEELLNSGVFVKKIWFEAGKNSEKILDFIKICENKEISFGEKTGKFLEKLSGSDKHQGIVAIYKSEESSLCFEKEKGARRDNYLCVYLDRIQDPQNFGAIVRSAEFFGIDQIFYPEFFGSPFNPTAQKAASGAGVHNQPYKITSVSNFFEKIKNNGFQVIGTSPENGKLLTEINFKKDTLLIIGSEGEGISGKTIKYCDDFVKIPKLGKIQSLNASVSAGIMLYHIQMISRNYNII